MMAAVLACGPDAALSDESAGIAFGMRRDRPVPIEVSIPLPLTRKRRGIVIHRPMGLGADIAQHRGIPITTPVRTLIDLAIRLPAQELEAAVNKADKLDLVDPETLRAALEQRRGQRGAPALRRLLDRHTFVLTDSELERLFLPIVRRARLPKPLTQHRVNGFRVDFY
jgi:hypothetical protein